MADLKPPTNKHDVEVARIKAVARIVVACVAAISAMIAAALHAWPG